MQAISSVSGQSDTSRIIVKGRALKPKKNLISLNLDFSRGFHFSDIVFFGHRDDLYLSIGRSARNHDGAVTPAVIFIGRIVSDTIDSVSRSVFESHED